MAMKLYLCCTRFPLGFWPPSCIFHFSPLFHQHVPIAPHSRTRNWHYFKHAALHQRHPHSHFSHIDLIPSKAIHFQRDAWDSALIYLHKYSSYLEYFVLWSAIFSSYFSTIPPFSSFFCSILVHQFKIRKLYDCIKTIHLASSVQPECMHAYIHTYIFLLLCFFYF